MAENGPAFLPPASTVLCNVTFTPSAAAPLSVTLPDTVAKVPVLPREHPPAATRASPPARANHLLRRMSHLPPSRIGSEVGPPAGGVSCHAPGRARGSRPRA